MEVKVFQGVRRIIHVNGEIDLSNVAALRVALDSAVQETPEGFIVDLSDAQYIDSAGIAAIMAAYQYICPDGGKLALVTPGGNIRNILALIHPEKLPCLCLCDDVASAEQMLSAQ